MAYALVLSATAEKKTGKTLFRWVQGVKQWINAFSPAPVTAAIQEVARGFTLHIITMPEPGVFATKNRLGKKRTLARWEKILKENGIGRYLLEKPLKAYLPDGWDAEQEDYLAESLKGKLPLLFTMEPLNGLKPEGMTLSVSGAGKEQITPELVQLFRKFKLINTIEEGTAGNSRWEEFMNETGVPVCITDDPGVLHRSDLWISFRDSPEPYLFRGIKLDLPGKNIICSKTKKQYRLGYTFQKGMLRKLGMNTVRRFHTDILAGFLLYAFMKDQEENLVYAETLLGIKINIVSSRLSS